MIEFSDSNFGNSRRSLAGKFSEPHWPDDKSAAGEGSTEYH